MLTTFLTRLWPPGHSSGPSSVGEVWCCHLQFRGGHYSDTDLFRRLEERVHRESGQQAAVPGEEAERGARRVHDQSRGTELRTDTGTTQTCAAHQVQKYLVF